MFCFNDAWLVNESLAFYMSTNTFNNPIFDAQLEQENAHQLREEPPENGSKVNKKASNGSHSFAAKQGRWAALCDGLVFSVSSKIYVLELNLKREFSRFKRFASDHLPGWILSGRRGNPLSGARKSFSSQQRPSFIKEDEIWKEVNKLSSRKALKMQQEKLLYRLEKVLQTIRREQQQSYQKEQPAPIAEDEQLLDRAEAQLSDGVTMQFARHPLESSESILMPSDLISHSLNPWNRLQSKQHQVGCKVESRSRALQANNKRKAKWIHRASPAGKRRVQDVSWANNDPSKLCIVCYTNSPNIVTLPCRHHDICSDCFIEIIYMAVKRSQYPLKCVLCRQRIERIRCSRRLLLSVIEKNRIRP